MVLGGGLDLDWRTPVPQIGTGEEWVVFLREREGIGYYPFAGLNSLLQVDGARLVQENKAPYWMTKQRLFEVLDTLFEETQ